MYLLTEGVDITVPEERDVVLAFVVFERALDRILLEKAYSGSALGQPQSLRFHAKMVPKKIAPLQNGEFTK